MLVFSSFHQSFSPLSPWFSAQTWAGRPHPGGSPHKPRRSRTPRSLSWSKTCLIRDRWRERHWLIHWGKGVSPERPSARQQGFKASQGHGGVAPDTRPVRDHVSAVIIHHCDTPETHEQELTHSESEPAVMMDADALNVTCADDVTVTVRHQRGGAGIRVLFLSEQDMMRSLTLD